MNPITQNVSYLNHSCGKTQSSLSICIEIGPFSFIFFICTHIKSYSVTLIQLIVDIQTGCVTLVHRHTYVHFIQGFGSYRLQILIITTIITQREVYINIYSYMTEYIFTCYKTQKNPITQNISYLNHSCSKTQSSRGGCRLLISLYIWSVCCSCSTQVKEMQLSCLTVEFISKQKIVYEVGVIQWGASQQYFTFQYHDVQAE